MKIDISLYLTLFISLAYGISFEEDVTLSHEQKMALDQFRKLVEHRLTQDYMKEDIYLIKWLRDQKFDVKNAERLITKNLEWRKAQRMDTINDEDWSDMEKAYKFYLEGRDKKGQPILYFDTHTIDFRKAVLAGKTERLLRFCDKSLENTYQLTRALGKKFGNITRAHLMINVQGYNLVEQGCLQCIPFLLRIVLSILHHYPECFDKIIAINAPAILEPLLYSIRPILPPHIRPRLQVFGTNRNQWKPILAKDFDFDKLPAGVGGTAVYKGMEEDDS